MEFVNMLGSLIIIVGFCFGFLYALRHRGAIAKWVNGIDHEDNVAEKERNLVALTRDKEDIERAIKKLELPD